MVMTNEKFNCVWYMGRKLTV